MYGERLQATSPGARAASAPSLVPAAEAVAVSSASIDGTFRELTSSLPESVRPVLSGLPHRLGLTSSNEGQFGDFVTLHPNRELPVYAAEDTSVDGGGEVPPDRVASFQRAHHLAAFYWLVRDRLADGQVTADDQLTQACELLRQRWVDTLTAATEDPGVAQYLIEEVTLDWERGVRGEKQALRRGVTTPGLHGRIVLDKLRWISSASVALLIDRGQL